MCSNPSINTDWRVETEFTSGIRQRIHGLDFKDFAYILAVGKRIGKWQAMATRRPWKDMPPTR